MTHSLAAALLVTIAGVLTAQSDTSTPAPAQSRSASATLVVVITVDQLRADYFARFDAQLTGGLSRLFRHGAVFTNAHQDHATTETAPGHASVLSGRHPRGTGIVSNLLGVYDPQSPVIGGGSLPASPFRFRGTTLTDWLRAKDPRTRALSVSRKDRGAILPLGRAKQHAFWYAADGRFTTSRYYADTLPAWVTQFNARRLPRGMAGRAWTLALDESAYTERDDVAVEGQGTGSVFPHVVPSDTAAAVLLLPNYPWIDEVTLAFALEGVRALGLGTGPHPDVLAISLSATDAIGHLYGPDSREVHDQIIRLDRMLGVFFDSLYARVDSSRVIVALTGDHGVAPYPGAPWRDPNRSAKVVDFAPVAQAQIARLRAAGVDSGAIRFEDATLYLERAAFARARVNADSAVRAFARAMRAVPGVSRVDLLRSLAEGDTLRDAVARRWLHMYPPDVVAELVVTRAPFNVPPVPYAAHGSPHDYDTHVPILFYGAPFRAGRYGGYARVVDIAPTLAQVLHVQPTEPIEGSVLRAALR